MFKFKIIKKILIFTLVLPTVLLLLIYSIQFTKKPNISNFVIVNELDINSGNTSEIQEIKTNTSKPNVSFQYKLIGYRSGVVDASVIVKKSNNEYVVALGEKLEGVFELVEVNQEEIIFRDGDNLYKIENLVGK